MVTREQVHSIMEEIGIIKLINDFYTNEVFKKELIEYYENWTLVINNKKYNDMDMLGIGLAYYIDEKNKVFNPVCTKVFDPIAKIDDYNANLIALTDILIMQKDVLPIILDKCGIVSYEAVLFDADKIRNILAIIGSMYITLLQSQAKDDGNEEKLVRYIMDGRGILTNDNFIEKMVKKNLLEKIKEFDKMN